MVILLYSFRLLAQKQTLIDLYFKQPQVNDSMQSAEIENF